MTITVKTNSNSNRLTFENVKCLGNKIYVGYYGKLPYRIYDVFEHIQNKRIGVSKNVWFHREGTYKSTYANVLEIID